MTRDLEIGLGEGDHRHGLVELLVQGLLDERCGGLDVFRPRHRLAQVLVPPDVPGAAEQAEDEDEAEELADRVTLLGPLGGVFAGFLALLPPRFLQLGSHLRGLGVGRLARDPWRGRRLQAHVRDRCRLVVLRSRLLARGDGLWGECRQRGRGGCSGGVEIDAGLRLRQLDRSRDDRCRIVGFRFCGRWFGQGHDRRAAWRGRGSTEHRDGDVFGRSLGLEASGSTSGMGSGKVGATNPAGAGAAGAGALGGGASGAGAPNAAPASGAAAVGGAGEPAGSMTARRSVPGPGSRSESSAGVVNGLTWRGRISVEPAAEAEPIGAVCTATVGSSVLTGTLLLAIARRARIRSRKLARVVSVALPRFGFPARVHPEVSAPSGQG